MADFSCYITINNQTRQTLTLNNYGQSWGYWKTAPPSSIAPNTSTIQMQLSDSSGPSGSTGWIKVGSGPGSLFSMNFDDPYTGSNSCSISTGGPMPSVYSVSFDAKSGSGSWQHNVCPSGGHPLYISFNIAETLPRAPTSAEISMLLGWFPSLRPSSVLVLGESTKQYNCIAWSLGLTYAWINPPSPLSTFNALYNTAANSVHSPYSGLGWQANSNWNTLAAVSPSAIIDGWGLDATDMTHGSRLMQSSDLTTATWTSKVGSSLLITHDRQGLVGSDYGSILTSFARVQPVPPAMAVALAERHEQMMLPEVFSAADRDALEAAVDGVPAATKEEFETLYAQWVQAIDERLAFSSDTRDSARLPEFAKLVALGRRILPLVVERMVHTPQLDFWLTVLYDALQRDEMLRVQYTADDPNQFEGEQSRAVRSAKLWLQALQRR